MTVMEEENKDLRDRLAGLAVDSEPAEGAEEGESAAADPAADGKDKQVGTHRSHTAVRLMTCRL